MKAIITGANGTVGSVLSAHLRSENREVFPWNRDHHQPGNEGDAQRFFDAVQPSALFHLALPSRPTGQENEGYLVNEKWTQILAELCAQWRIPMLYVSTAMVFSNRAQGPFYPDREPDETEGYGYSKVLGERAARLGNPEIRIARLGWQIGEKPGSNNMIDFFDKQMKEHGEIRASTKWLPATSFLGETARQLAQIIAMEPGVYHIDSNRDWNFFQIATALNHLHGNLWNIKETDDFVYDQRMPDRRLDVSKLNAVLDL